MNSMLLSKLNVSVLSVLCFGCLFQALAEGESSPLENAKPLAAKKFVFKGGETITVHLSDNQSTRSFQQTVTKDGTISSPAGIQNIMGKTLDEAYQILKTAAQKELGLRKPQISIALNKIPVRKIYVQGEVETPQSIELPQDLDIRIAAALAAAGGTKPNADVTKVMLLRRGFKPLQIDASSLLQGEGNSVGPVLEDGDSIVVPRSEFFSVTGEVEKPGVYGRNDAGVLPGEKLRLSHAIAAAGGMKDSAYKSRVRLIRVGQGGSRKTQEFDLRAESLSADLRSDPELQQGDQIQVPTSEGVMIIGKVKQPGVFYPIGGPMTVTRLIAMAAGFEEFAGKSNVKVLRKGQRSAPETVNVQDILEGQGSDLILNPGDLVFVK